MYIHLNSAVQTSTNQVLYHRWQATIDEQRPVPSIVMSLSSLLPSVQVQGREMRSIVSHQLPLSVSENKGPNIELQLALRDRTEKVFLFSVETSDPRRIFNTDFFLTNMQQAKFNKIQKRFFSANRYPMATRLADLDSVLGMHKFAVHSRVF